MADFLDLVLTMNPILRSDERVNAKMVNHFLSAFDTEIGSKSLINYDALLDKICATLNLPERVVEPFMEMYATAHFALTGRKFIRLCRRCGKGHGMGEIQECGMLESSIIKTSIGFVLVDDKEDISAVKN